MKLDEDTMTETNPATDSANCQEKTLNSILMLLQKYSSVPKPAGYEDSVLTESDTDSIIL